MAKNFHKAYAIGWVNTNNHQEHIDISMEKLEIRRKGEVIAKIQALNNGELLIKSTTGDEKAESSYPRTGLISSHNLDPRGKGEDFLNWNGDIDMK